ncbi:hypothetical protein ACWEWX_52010, partial [Streptomyces asiaticus]
LPEGHRQGVSAELLVEEASLAIPQPPARRARRPVEREMERDMADFLTALGPPPPPPPAAGPDPAPRPDRPGAAP